MHLDLELPAVLSGRRDLVLWLVLAFVVTFLLTRVGERLAGSPSELSERWSGSGFDQFGLEITRDNHNAATAFVKLQMENLSNPRPGLLYKLWRTPPIA